MATGPILVDNKQQTAQEDGPSTSASMERDVNCTPHRGSFSGMLSANRRYSFRSIAHRNSSSSDDDDNEEFSAGLNDMRKRRYSMVDIQRNRSNTATKRHSFALSVSDHSTIMQRSHTMDDTFHVSGVNVLDSKFVAPTAIKAQNSRPTSPSRFSAALVRPLAVASKRRLASIRRESDCSVENEVAHEKLVKTAQQASASFEDFCLDERNKEERKRAKSLAEPISVFTNAFLPQSSSPSPKGLDTKQCYSPLSQQIIRNNPYSPSQSPSPNPTRSRIMRSMSPIASRQISKRRYTATGSGIDSDSENSTSQQLGASTKRQCLIPQRSAASPLVRDSISVQQSSTDGQSEMPAESFRSSSPASVCSNSSSIYNNNMSRARIVNPDCISVHSDAADDTSIAEQQLPDQLFLNATNDNSSTTFSSRAVTPIDEQMSEDTAALNNNLNSPMRSSAYNSSLPPPSPLSIRSISMNDCTT